MTMNEMMKNVCSTASTAATTTVRYGSMAVSWAGRTITVLATAGGKALAQASETMLRFAKAVMNFATPYFSSFRSFVAENRTMIAVAAGSAAVGAIAYSVVNNIVNGKSSAEAPAI
jgi:hypothetical protein